MPVVIAVDESNNATAIVVVNCEDLPRLTREFGGIKHFREVKRNRVQHLKEEFKPKLEKAMRKYYLELRYYAKLTTISGKMLNTMPRFGLEIIVDNKERSCG